MMALNSDGKTKIIDVKYIPVILYIILLAIHLLVSLSSDVPLIHADEHGYISNARQILYYNIIRSESVNYYPGYSLFLTPAFLINNNMEITYKLIQIINSLIMSFIPVFVYKLIPAFKDDVSIKNRFIISLTISLYPSFIVFSNLAMAEALFIPLYLFLVLQIYLISLNPAKKLLWVSTISSYILLVLTHPRAFAILPVLLIAIFIIIFRENNKLTKFMNDKHKKIFFIISAIFVAIFVVAIAVVVIKTGGGYGSGILRSFKSIVSFLGLTNVFITGVSQMYYLILSTFGFALLGLFFGITIIIKDRYFLNKKIISDRKNNIVVLFTVLSFLSELLLSAFFASNASGADHIIYGRYNEGVLMPILIMGAILFIDELKAKNLLKLSLIASSILIFVFFTRGYNLEHLSMNKVNVFGIYIGKIVSGKFNYIMWTSTFVILTVIVFLVRKFNKRMALFTIAFIYAISIAFISMDYFYRGSLSRDNQRQLVYILRDYESRNNKPMVVNYERNGGFTGGRSWHRFNYPVFVPDMIMHRFRIKSDTNKIEPNSDIIMSIDSDVNKTYKGARIAGLENHCLLKLWILPGDNLNYYINKGYVLPENFPSPLPDGAYKSLIECKGIGDKFNLKNIKIPISITHMGTESFWPNLYGVLKPEYSVRLGARLMDINGEAKPLNTTRFELPGSVYPGQTVDINTKFNLEDLYKTAQIKDGDYILSFELVQEAVTWFSQKGDKALNLHVKIDNGKFIILKKI